MRPGPRPVWQKPPTEDRPQPPAHDRLQAASLPAGATDPVVVSGHAATIASAPATIASRAVTIITERMMATAETMAAEGTADAMAFDLFNIYTVRIKEVWSNFAVKTMYQ